MLLLASVSFFLNNVVTASEQPTETSSISVSVSKEKQLETKEKISEETKNVLIDLGEKEILKRQSEKCIRKEFRYLGSKSTPDTVQYEFSIICSISDDIVDEYFFIAQENLDTGVIEITVVTGPVRSSIGEPAIIIGKQAELAEDGPSQINASLLVKIVIFLLIIIAFLGYYVVISKRRKK